MGMGEPMSAELADCSASPGASSAGVGFLLGPQAGQFAPGQQWGGVAARDQPLRRSNPPGARSLSRY